MAKKAPKSEKPKTEQTSPKKTNPFFGDDYLAAVADVADTERNVPEVTPTKQATSEVENKTVFLDREGVSSPMPLKEESRSVGRPKKKVALRDKKPKTTYFDIGTHQRIKLLRAFSEVEVKDLILVSVIDFLDKYCDADGRLSRIGERHIENVMNKVYEEYGEISE